MTSGPSPQVFPLEELREDHSTWFPALQDLGGLALLQAELPVGNAGPFSIRQIAPCTAQTSSSHSRCMAEPEDVIPVGQKVTVSHGVGAQCQRVGRCQPTLLPSTSSSEAPGHLEGA